MTEHFPTDDEIVAQVTSSAEQFAQELTETTAQAKEFAEPSTDRKEAAERLGAIGVNPVMAERMLPPEK